jgi:hypothetical protein
MTTSSVRSMKAKWFRCKARYKVDDAGVLWHSQGYNSESTKVGKLHHSASWWVVMELGLMDRIWVFRSKPAVRGIWSRIRWPDALE